MMLDPDLTITTAQFDSVPACRTGTAQLVTALGKSWTDNEPVPIGFVIKVVGEQYALVALDTLGLAPKVRDALAARSEPTAAELAVSLADNFERVKVDTELTEEQAAIPEEIVSLANVLEAQKIEAAEATAKADLEKIFQGKPALETAMYTKGQEIGDKG